MKHISEVFNKVRSVLFVMMTGLFLVVLVGTSGCSFGGSSGSGSSGSKEDPPGCTDRDGDGYYAEEGCGKRLDCNDRDQTINPQAKEYCVGIDNDCDGLIDEDCLPEICDDGIDNDGDGIIDEACQLGNSFVSDTGQTRCYDTMGFLYPCPSPGEEFYGQDACFSIISSPFIKLDAGGSVLTKDAAYWSMVKDRVTGLIWEVKTEDGTIHDKNLVSEWEDAGDVFITQLNNENFGGFSDWRLPTIIELDSIVNLIGRIPAIDTDYFPNTKDYFYWSSMDLITLGKAKAAWVLNFHDSVIDWRKRDESCYMRAVRGPVLLLTFTDNGDGTVTADFNGKSLMWARDSSPERMEWQEALDYCNQLELAGYSDWRMPNIKELHTLVDYERYDPAVNVNFFPDTNSSGYWSSTTNPGDTSEALIGNLADGRSLGGSDKTYVYHKCHVRPVRGGQ